jgi:hypothetical protein
MPFGAARLQSFEGRTSARAQRFPRCFASRRNLDGWSGYERSRRAEKTSAAAASKRFAEGIGEGSGGLVNAGEQLARKRAAVDNV